MVTPQLETAGGSGKGPEMPIPAPLKPVTAARAAPAEKAPPPAEPAAEPKPPAAKPEAQQAPPTAAPAAVPESPPAIPHAIAATPEQPAAAVEQQPRPQPATRAKPAEQTPPRARDNGIAADACLLLLHVDVADVLKTADHTRLQRLLHAHSGWRVATSATYGGGSGMAKQALDMIEQAHWQAPPPRVAMLADGSQPPITESLRFLRQARAAAGEHAQLLLLLVGDPDGEDPLPPLSEFDFQDWQRKIEQLGDPYLRLEMLAGAAEEED
jgi:hypothetical protein